MKPESLRSEFILTGGATLLSVYLLVVSLERRSRPSCFSHGQIMRTCTVHPFAIPSQLQAAGTAVAGIAVLVGLAFVVGIIVVQVTFFFPTEGLIHVRRRKRIRELRSLDAELRERHEANRESHYTILEKAFRQAGELSNDQSFHEFSRFYFRKFTRRPVALSAEESLLFSIGRQLAADSVIREYEYRRSNRQVFVGVLPAFIIAVAAAVINPWSSQRGIQDICEVAAVLVGLAIVYALCASANYQERVAQAQLLDTAFTALWSQQSTSSPAAGRPTDGQLSMAPVTGSEQSQPNAAGEEQECTSKE